MRVGYFCLIMAVCFFQTLKANNDTLSIAKGYIQQGKYNKAEKILRAFEKSHPNDLNTLWLYGQTAYWNGNMKTFKRVYDKAILRFPSNYYLKLDYVIKLENIGDAKKAMPLLVEYAKYDKSSPDFKLLVAKMEYWYGDNKEALQDLKDESLIKQKPEEAKQLKEEILAAQSFWLKAGADYIKDDQPMQQVVPVLEAGKYFTKLLSPVVSLQIPFYKTDSVSTNAMKWTISNKFNFPKLKLRAILNAGSVQLPDKTNEFCGGIELVKTNFTYLQLTAIAARQPYLTTISSLYAGLVPYHYEFNLAWNNQNSWNGKIISSYDQFTADNNYVYNVGAWVFAPPVKLTKLQLRLGYAYGYASSKENTYSTVESLAKIVSDFNSGKPIEGRYQPYFTPTNQQTHSALLNVLYNPSKKIETGLNASIAFAGDLDNPYLYLDKNSANQLYINKGYSQLKFYPHKVDAFVLFKLTKKASLKANYTFFKNNFYTSHLIGASVILNFWND